MLTSDQVAHAVGTPGPYTGAHEDPAQDGSLVWGCTWGTQNSYADVRETSASRFPKVGSDSVSVITPLSGIGDKAVLQTFKSGPEPNVYFAVAGHYYDAIKAAPAPIACPARRATRADHESSGVELLLDFTGLAAAFAE